MTHYNIDYSKLQEPQKHEQALKDIQEFLGEAKFNELTELTRNGKRLSYREWNLAMFLSGIEGYPLVAWYNHIYDLTPGDVDDDFETELANIVEDQLQTHTIEHDPNDCARKSESGA